MEIQRAL
jgi:hypothetical protein